MRLEGSFGTTSCWIPSLLGSDWKLRGPTTVLSDTPNKTRVWDAAKRFDD